MRILFLFGGTHANYLEDLLYAGLVAHFGADAVACSVGSEAEGEGEGGGCAKAHFGPVRPERYPERACWSPRLPAEFCYPEALRFAATCDLVVVGRPATPAMAAFQSEVVTRAGARAGVVGVDGEDLPRLDMLRGVVPEGPWFVREIQKLGGEACGEGRGEKSRERGGWVFPLPLCYNAIDLEPPAPWAERDIDLLWVGAAHHGRVPWIKALEKLKAEASEGFRVEVRTDPIAHTDYLAMLRRAKTALVLPGAGNQTYRYLEALAAGCVPVGPYAAHFGSDIGGPLGEARWVTESPSDLGMAVTDVAGGAGLSGYSALAHKHTHVARAAQFVAEVWSWV